MEIVISICASAVGETIPYCCFCIFSGTQNTVKFQKNLDELDKEMKNLMDLRNDFQQRSTTTVSSAEKDGKAPTIEEWLREAEELERKVLFTQKSIVAAQNSAEIPHKCQDCSARYKFCLSKVALYHKLKQSNTKVDRFSTSVLSKTIIDSHSGASTRNKNGREFDSSIIKHSTTSLPFHSSLATCIAEVFSPVSAGGLPFRQGEEVLRQYHNCCSAETAI